jgi:uncharacterized protein YdeI (YjbR/CyaY-like superfamily)
LELGKTLQVTERADWRSWLADHYLDEPEIWLVYYRKETGKPRILYADAVEEALCFGWIDSIVKKLDEERTAQRFSPRRARSGYSQTNIERLRRLAGQGLVAADVLSSLGDLLDQEFIYPADIMAALRENEDAWRYFQGYPAAYQRIRVAYVEDARDRPGEFEKRLANLVNKTAAGKQFGFGIESFYQ